MHALKIVHYIKILTLLGTDMYAYIVVMYTEAPGTRLYILFSVEFQNGALGITNTAALALYNTHRLQLSVIVQCI